MKYFLNRILVFVLIPMSIGLLITILFSNIIPSPRITPSYTLNEKLFFFDDFDKNYLCIGSSVSLNNISSEQIVSGLGSESYINLSSAGVTPADIYKLLKIYTDEFTPRYFIFPSNEIDFLHKDKEFDLNKIHRRIKYPYVYLNPLLYLTNLDLEYYFKNYPTHQLFKKTDTTTRSIKYDKYGGVLVNKGKLQDNRLNSLWSLQVDISDIADSSYNYLDSICKLTYENDIKFVFIQSPIRQGLVDEAYKTKMNNHLGKVNDLLLKYDHQLIDGTQVEWPDSLFFDYGHLLADGARSFTTFCINKIKENQQLNVTMGHTKKSQGLPNNQNFSERD